MRVFLIWAAKTLELIYLMQELKNHSHELVYWVGHHLAKDDDNLPSGVIFHSHKEAGLGLPAAGVQTADFSPPDEKIISQLHHADPMILIMLNDAYHRTCISEYRNFYYQILRYWLGVFKKYRPDIIIFPVEPHSGFDYVIYELAKILSVKTLFFNETRVSDRMLYMNDFKKGSDTLRQAIENNRNKKFTIEDLSDDLRQYCYRCVISKDSTQPQYIDFLKKKYSLKYRFSFAKIISSIKDGSIVRKTINFIFEQKGLSLFVQSFKKLISRFKPNLKKEYISLQTVLNLNQEFIYVPLQVQPERSTSPVGGIFVDQILALETLSFALPAGWKIFVKEHPMQWIRKGINYTSSRHRGYYKQISKIKNVQLIPVELNSYFLIDKARAVMTVSGAPGWEAITRLKPAIVFGYSWYKDCPGVFSVNSVESCRQAMEIIRQGFAADQQAVINYLKSLDQSTIHGYIARSNEKASKLNHAENIKSITNLILDELEKFPVKNNC